MSFSKAPLDDSHRQQDGSPPNGFLISLKVYGNDVMLLDKNLCAADDRCQWLKISSMVYVPLGRTTYGPRRGLTRFRGSPGPARRSIGLKCDPGAGAAQSPPAMKNGGTGPGWYRNHIVDLLFREVDPAGRAAVVPVAIQRARFIGKILPDC
jgi:hypothetical protein